VIAMDTAELETSKYSEEYAIYMDAFPCNPLPFLRRIYNICKKEGYRAMKNNKVKSCLFILNALAYGQLFSINGISEYDRLYQTLKRSYSKYL
jgi:hypothetical protein